MTPIEFDYAMKDINEMEQERAKTLYTGFRYLAMHLWNMQGRRLKKMIKTPEDLEKFSWEKETEKQQSVEEMKGNILNIFYHFKNKFKDKERRTKPKGPRK